MIGYWLFRRENNRAYCFVWELKRAKEIASRNNCEIVETWVDD